MTSIPNVIEIQDLFNKLCCVNTKICERSHAIQTWCSKVQIFDKLRFEERIKCFPRLPCLACPLRFRVIAIAWIGESIELAKTSRSVPFCAHRTIIQNLTSDQFGHATKLEYNFAISERSALAKTDHVWLRTVMTGDDRFSTEGFGKTDCRRRCRGGSTAMASYISISPPLSCLELLIFLPIEDPNLADRYRSAQKVV
jgi:hypothetical protein